MDSDRESPYKYAPSPALARDASSSLSLASAASAAASSSAARRPRGPPPAALERLEALRAHEVACVELFRGEVLLSAVLQPPPARQLKGGGGLLSPVATATAASASAAGGRGSPSSSPHVRQRKASNFSFAGVPMGTPEPAHSGAVRAELRVVCAEPEVRGAVYSLWLHSSRSPSVPLLPSHPPSPYLPLIQVLTLDRSLVVTASTRASVVLDRNTFASGGPASVAGEGAGAGAGAVPPALSRHGSATSSGSLHQSQSQGLSAKSSLVTVPPFDTACPHTLALPSICLVDAAQAVAFAATLSEQLYLELAWDGSAVALKIKDAKYYA